MMSVIMLMIMVMNTVTASAPGSEMHIKPGGCHKLGSGVTEIPSNIPSNTQCLRVKQTQIREIPQGALTSLQHLRKLIIMKNDVLESISTSAFANLSQLTYIIISENLALERIEAFAFSNLPELTEINIEKSKHLSSIHPDAFGNITKLQHLTISHTTLRIFPNFSKIQSTATELLFQLQENSHIERVPANAFRGLCTQAISEIRLTRNGIKEVASDAFNGTRMKKLSLRGNKHLTHINPNAFVGSSELVVL